MDPAIVGALIGASAGVFGIAGTIIGTRMAGDEARKTALATAREIAEVEQAKYVRDRLWDVRREAYAAMIARVSAMRRIAVLIDEHFRDPEGSAEEYFSSEHFRRKSDELWNTWRKFVVEFDEARIILSDDFVARFDKLTNEIFGEEADIPPSQYHDTRVALEGAAEALLAIARAEIAPPP